MNKCAELLLVTLLAPMRTEHHIEHEFAWAQFTYNYSEHKWCVDAQRRDALPGEMIGGCWQTLVQAEQGILEMQGRKK